MGEVGKSGPYMYIDTKSYEAAHDMANAFAEALRQHSMAEKVTKR